jgi:hypothetical protein
MDKPEKYLSVSVDKDKIIEVRGALNRLTKWKKPKQRAQNVTPKKQLYVEGALDELAMEVDEYDEDDDY